MLNLQDITSQCAAHGSLAGVYWLEPSAVVSMPVRKNDGTLPDPLVVLPDTIPKSIQTVRSTGTFTSQVDTKADAGDYIKSTLTIKVAGNNAPLEEQFFRIAESRVHVLFIDFAGAVRFMPFAGVRQSFYIPTQRGKRREYSIIFESTGLYPLGIFTADPYIVDVDGLYWALPDNSAWTDPSGAAWIFD